MQGCRDAGMRSIQHRAAEVNTHAELPEAPDAALQNVLNFTNQLALGSDT